MTRKNLGCKTLVTLYDTRWNDIGRAMIASIEVDMNNNSGILYCSPDFMMSIKDFIKHIHIGIQTKGYKEANSGDNLLVHVAFLGRCTTNSRIKYKVFVDQVVELLSSKGIKMIKPLNID